MAKEDHPLRADFGEYAIMVADLHYRGLQVALIESTRNTDSPCFRAGVTDELICEYPLTKLPAFHSGFSFGQDCAVEAFRKSVKAERHPPAELD